MSYLKSWHFRISQVPLVVQIRFNEMVMMVVQNLVAIWQICIRIFTKFLRIFLVRSNSLPKIGETEIFFDFLIVGIRMKLLKALNLVPTHLHHYMYNT